MSTEENKALARRYHHDIYLAGKLEVADEIVTPDFAIHQPPPLPGPGPEGVKEDAAWFRNVFRVDQLSDDDIVAEGDKVMIRWTFRGAQKAQYGDIAPIGRELTFTGFDLFRIENGKLAELWTLLDEASMLRQMGAVLPSP
jgi:predicted SnoaL-like aldol condensation-catalyzing enzyme